MLNLFIMPSGRLPNENGSGKGFGKEELLLFSESLL